MGANRLLLLNVQTSARMGIPSHLDLRPATARIFTSRDF